MIPPSEEPVVSGSPPFVFHPPPTPTEQLRDSGPISQAPGRGLPSLGKGKGSSHPWNPRKRQNVPRPAPAGAPAPRTAHLFPARVRARGREQPGVSICGQDARGCELEI